MPPGRQKGVKGFKGTDGRENNKEYATPETDVWSNDILITSIGGRCHGLGRVRSEIGTRSGVWGSLGIKPLIGRDLSRKGVIEQFMRRDPIASQWGGMRGGDE